MRDPATGEERIARVKVPPVLPRFVSLPDGERIVPLEEVIAANLGGLFPGDDDRRPPVLPRHEERGPLLEEEEAEDLLVAVEMELRRRRFGRAVRLEVRPARPAMRALLLRELDLSEEAVYTVDAPIGLSGLWSVYAIDRAD